MLPHYLLFSRFFARILIILRFLHRVHYAFPTPFPSFFFIAGLICQSPLTEISGLKSYELIVCYRNLSAITKSGTHLLA